MILRTGQAFWPLRSGLLASYPALVRDEAAEIAIVGAGITGALAAYELTIAGADVIVLDKGDVAMGSSAASTGLLMSATDKSLEELTAAIGEDAAARTYRLGLEAVDRIEAIAATFDDGCGFSRRRSLYLASTDKDARGLAREHALRVKHGFDVELLNRADLTSQFGASRPAALFSEGDGQVDCYRLTHRLLAAARSRGARIYDRTNVVGMRCTADGIRLKTGGGRTIRAKKLVHAAGYETVKQLRRHTGSLSSTWVFISEPLDPFHTWPDRCLIWETARPYLYMRTTDDGRVVVGGEDEPFSRRHENDRLLVTKSDRLRKKVRRLMPWLDLDVAYRWAGVFGTTDDGLPFIGSVPGYPHTWFALGYGGNGITFSAIAARVFCDAYLGRPNPDAAIFAFDRPTAPKGRRWW